MYQISNRVYCDDFIAQMKFDNVLHPNPYYDYPYLLIENFFSRKLCRAVLEHVAKSADVQKAQVKRMKKKSVVVAAVNSVLRNTDIYALPSVLLSQYRDCFTSHQPTIERYFNCALTLMTTPQLLVYEKGAFYVKHADDSSEIVNSEGQSIGFKVVASQRKLTSVLFISAPGAYECGELYFNYLYNEEGECIRIKPQEGTLLLFPSNPLFSHEVQKVKSGQRVTLVQWHNALIS